MTEEARIADTGTVPQIAPTFRLQWEEAQGCYVVLYPEGMIRLSASAGEILKRCDGGHSVGAILRELQDAYPGADLKDDVKRFLEKAYANGWICAKRDNGAAG